MKKRIRNINQFECRRCGQTYWTTDSRRGWCGGCQSLALAAVRRRRNAKQERAGQMRLDLE